MSRLASRLATRSAVAVTAFALLAGFVTIVAAPPAAAAFPDGMVRFEGHGWGHGRGLGQYGSLGYAVDENRDHSWIVNHFYGGTTKGHKADGLISVKLIYLDGTTAAPTDMTVTSGRAFTVGDPHRLENQFAAGEWGRVRWNGSGWTIERAVACGGPWIEVQKLANADLRPEARTDYTGDDITQMLTVLQPAADKPCTEWNKRTYRGSLMIARLDSVFTRVLNWVNMEQYLRGVVPRESPASWGTRDGGKGMEALKAQAVAARSYAWAENRHTDYKTCDTTSCQVYGGAALNGLRSEHALTDTAVAATAGEVRLRPDRSVARTEFSSSTGGHTDGPSFTPVPDTGDDIEANPNHQWSASVPVSSIESKHPQIGSLRSIGVLDRNGLGARGGRATSVQVVGSSGSVTLNGDGAIRGGLGLKSAWFTVVDVPLDVTRLQGPDRFATSTAISSDLFDNGTADAAVIVSARNYPDAIVGVPLAAAKNAPILLSEADGVPDATMTELQRATGGGKGVYLLGGTAALGQAVEDQLAAAGYDVTRFGGATRAATAVLVAEALGDPTTILEATGAGFADALAAGAAAAKAGGAVLLTAGAEQAPETAAYLEGKSVTRYAVGGDAAKADPSATPLAGADRYETALEVANKFFPGPASVGLASGTDFADALGGGVHASEQGGPLILTHPTTLPTSTKNYVQGNAEITLRQLYVYGGTAAVSEQVITALKTR